jgi:hypothetical protein
MSARKPLKRLDSEKEMKGNEREFVLLRGFFTVQAASGRRLENQMCPCGRVSAWLAGAAASRLEMAPQRIEKVESAPGNGMAAEILDPLYLALALGQRDRRRIPVAARLVARIGARARLRMGRQSGPRVVRHCRTFITGLAAAPF